MVIYKHIRDENAWLRMINEGKYGTNMVNNGYSHTHTHTHTQTHKYNEWVGYDE